MTPTPSTNPTLAHRTGGFDSLAAGLDYVRYAADNASSRPWFAIGGIEPGNVGEVIAAGASRIVVVRAIRDADDPRAAAAALREALPDPPGDGPRA